MIYIHLTINLGLIINIKNKLDTIMTAICARHILVETKKALKLKGKFIK